MRSRLLSIVALLLFANWTWAQAPFGKTIDEVNGKMVKLFGAGGFRGVASYGTGVIVSPQGHILTCASAMLDTFNLRAHMPDGRRFESLKIIVIEPELDLALIKIDHKFDEPLPYYNIAEAAKAPMAQTGDWVLGFSNTFQIATRDEPLSVQKGVIQAYSKLQGRRGVFEAPYRGEVYVIDAITNNPGAAGGVITDRKGRLLGIIGKELRNTLSDTWINYAVPVQATVEVQVKDQKVSLSVADFVAKAIKGEYTPVAREKPVGGPQGYHGIVLVPDVIDRTPPFVEEVRTGSPAAKAGLRPDDLVVYIDGEQIISVKHFKEIMNAIRPGSEVTLEIRRGEKLQTVKVKLDEPLAKKP